jgi:hypothetical protein
MPTLPRCKQATLIIAAPREMLRRLLDELKAEKIDGLVVDLRNNGGGSLTEANYLNWIIYRNWPYCTSSKC